MPETPMAELAKTGVLVGGPFGSSLVGLDYEDDGIPVIRGGNLGHGAWVGGDFVFVSQTKFERELARNNATPGDLVFTQRGTLGQVAMVPDGDYGRYVISQSQMRLRVDKTKFEPRYVYYACVTEAFKRQISDNAIATGVPHINLGILGRLLIPEPPLGRQGAIAEILWALDDKIAANQAMSSTTDALVAALFSRVCISSATSPLSSIASVNVTTVKPAPGGKLRYLDIASVGQGRYESPELMDWNDAPSRARRAVQRGDTVWSTVRPNRRSHALVLESDPMLVASTGLAVLTPHPGRVACLFESTRRPEFGAYLMSVAEGSAYPAVNASRFERAPVPELEADGWDAFESLAMPLRERAHAAAMESDALAETRDALLPLLMSGKVRVKDAEKIAEEAL